MMNDGPPIVFDMGHPILHVKDLDSSIKFYRDILGFQVVDTKHEECCGRVKVAIGKGTLILFRADDFAPIGLGPRGLGSPFHLHVESFAQAVDRLQKKGVRVHREGPHYGTIFDPSGNAIGLVEDPTVQADGGHHPAVKKK